MLGRTLSVVMGFVLFGCETRNLEIKPAEIPDRSRYAELTEGVDGSLRDLMVSETETGDEGAYGINAILWSSAVQTVSFMGVKAVDPSSGTLVTDWYRSSVTDPVEYQVTINIIGKTLRSDAVNVTTARRNPESKVGGGSAEELSQQLKNAILTKARQIRQDRAGGL